MHTLDQIHLWTSFESSPVSVKIIRIERVVKFCHNGQLIGPVREMSILANSNNWGYALS